MAISFTKEERMARFNISQLGRYGIAFFVIGLSFLLLFFSPTKDPAPYIGLAGTLISGIVMFYFSKSTSNEKMPTDAGSIEEIPATQRLPFVGNGPASAGAVPNDARVTPAGEIHASACGCGDCEPYVEPQYWNPTTEKASVMPVDPKEFDAVIEELKKDAKADGITWNPMYAAMNFKVWLFNHIPVGSDIWSGGIAYALNLAKKAYKDVVGAEAPTTYAPIANYNKFIATLKKDTTNKYGCGKTPVEAVRVAVMTLREILKYHEELS